MYNKTYIKNWHNEIKISNWKTSPNQKVYIQHIEFYRVVLETFVWQTRKRWKFLGEDCLKLFNLCLIVLSFLNNKIFCLK